MLSVHITRHVTRVVITATIAVLAAAWPAAAEAQRHRPRRPGPAVRSVVYVGYAGWWGPRYAFYDPFWQGRWGPYPPYGYRPYVVPYGVTSALRIDVTPRDAEVFVDGYAAGIVDEFDGIFQRLRLEPGGHDITLYLPGYRTVTESLYLRPDGSHRIRLTMERLRPGETSEPPPAPSERTDRYGGREGPVRSPEREETPAPEQERRDLAARFGTLAVRVQPADAEIVIDGERWSAPAGQSVVSIRLSEGRHKVEVRKPGFMTYTEDVLIQPGRTLTLNVSLTGGLH